MKTMIALRLSAMGDVAMTLPVLTAAVDQYPDLRIVFVTRAAWMDLIPKHPRLVKHPFHPKTTHKGLLGLWRLHRELLNYQPDYIADLHHVLRTQLLCALFTLSRCRIATINKGRQDKKRLVMQGQKAHKPLRHTIDRYQEVLARLGYPVTLALDQLPLPARAHTIGVAPFAAHQSKAYPLDKMRELVQRLLSYPDRHIVLYGGGPIEGAQLAQWAEDEERIRSTHDLSLHEQLSSMKSLDLMICMDSANMHLASLMGVPALSIWGGTHPYAGFTGYRQPEQLIVQRDDLQCRPCSVFGSATCARGDWACMDIPPAMIESRMASMLR